MPICNVGLRTDALVQGSNKDQRRVIRALVTLVSPYLQGSALVSLGYDHTRVRIERLQLLPML